MDVIEQPLGAIAQLVVNEALLDKEKALRYQAAAKQNNQSFLQYVFSNFLLDEKIAALAIAKQYNLPFWDIDKLDISNLPIHLMNEKLIKHHRMLPLYQQGRHLFLATDDPSKLDSLQEIQFHTGFTAHAIVVLSHKLDAAIDTLWPETKDQVPEKKEASIVNFVNKIITEAFQKGASDIHFEPYEKEYRIRYRLDGTLMEVARPLLSLSGQINSRLKVLANLDISERRLPQDGRFTMKLANNRSIDLRVSTCPSSDGEKVVLRLLDPSTKQLNVNHLGFNVLQLQHFLKALAKPQGMIIVTGPTGSGKTQTLYTALSLLNTPEVNIVTAEDPIEIKLAGINQVNVNLKAGLSFAKVLRAFLRQDPDIIMVGEIRDKETAEIAFKAAETGHLVLSTLHTNSAIETLSRLLHLGIPPWTLASTLQLIIAQRLVRKLCPHCKKSSKENTQIYHALGCSLCNQGYSGRLGLFEILRFSEAFRQGISSEAQPAALKNLAEQEGMTSLFDSGKHAVLEGITSEEELRRVTIES